MGLDAYLYHSNNWEKSLKTEQEIEELDRRVWDNCKGDDSHMTDDAFRDYKRTLLEEAEKQGFIVIRTPSEDGADTNDTSFIIDTGITEYTKDSELYPEHLFKIGYFRSSYNDAGFNNVMRSMGFPDLYDVFKTLSDVDDTSYKVIDWKAARACIDLAIKKMTSTFPTGLWFLDLNRVSYYGKGGKEVPSAAEALSITEKELESSLSKKTPFSSYANANGEFYTKGLQTVAIVGRRWLVYKLDETDGGIDWYLKAAKIVKETIDFVLGQPDPQNWRLYWSA